MKTCAFYTLGCKVNQYETQSIREDFLNAGYREVKFSEPADVYVINTCTVTAKTDRESRRLIREARKRNPHTLLVVTGCYTELNEADIKGTDGASLIVKNRDKDKIVNILNSEDAYTHSDDGRYLPLAISDFKNRTKAFLKVQDGCDNFCSYCKVPLARGRSMSRDIKSAVAEMERLILKGFKEVVLTGVCLGAWGEDLSPEESLDELLKELIRLEGDFRIRLSSIEPKYVNASLVELIESSPKLCNHLHIPLQSGDDEILERMNRPYSSREYLDIIETARSRIPEVSITTDILLGFPGEEESNFANTYELVEKIGFSRVHIFSYSRREGTAALDLGEDVPKDIVKRRMGRIRNLVQESSYNFRRKFLHRETSVLIEHERDRRTGLLTGYDERYIKVLLEGADTHMFKIAPVRIEKVEMAQTLGALV